MGDTLPGELRYALFDFDGVIADTEPHYMELDRRALARLGYEATADELRTFIGHPSEVMAGRLLASRGLAATADDFLREREDPATIYADPALMPSPGLAELWELLRGRGVAVAVVSTSRVANIVRALDRFGLLGHVSVIVGRELVERHKPDPEPYLRALSWLAPREASGAVAPLDGAAVAEAARHAVAFEDSAAGIASARTAGIYTFGYQGGAEVSESPGASEVVTSFAEAAEQLRA